MSDPQVDLATARLLAERFAWHPEDVVVIPAEPAPAN